MANGSRDLFRWDPRHGRLQFGKTTTTVVWVGRGAPAGYAPLYRMVTDRFGVTWVLDVPPYNG